MSFILEKKSFLKTIFKLLLIFVINFNLKNLSIKEVKNRLSLSHKDLVSIVESSFVSFKKKSIFLDKDFGSWKAVVQSVLNGSRHPQRAKFDIRQKTLINIKEELYAKFGSTIAIDQDSFSIKNKKAIFIDSVFGKWHASYNNVIAGLGHPNRAKIEKSYKSYSTASFNKALYGIYSGKVKLIEPYKGILDKHKFVDIDFGEFEAYAANVLHKGTGHIKRAVLRRKTTSIKKYGVEHPMQVPEIALRCAKSNVMSECILHWKTNEELVCTANYEISTVKWLNKNKINFDWQPKTFVLPNGKTYRPDLFIIDEDLWVEIKGFFRKKSKEKWEWFNSLYPNSELWDKKKLKELYIL